MAPKTWNTSLSAAYADRYKAKAKALATYMVKGDVTSENLLRNGRAIAHLFNEAGRPDPSTVTIFRHPKNRFICLGINPNW